MKKIDLHVHTVSTVSDHPFEFSIGGLLQYISQEKIDAIAITNHNMFDKGQYESIVNAISIPVFPGIEIDIEGGHLLVITNIDDIDDFSAKCAQIYRVNGGSSASCITEADFINIFHDLKKYLLIPHYDKSPSLKLEHIPRLKEFITCGEVSSGKKFICMKKTQNEIVPVLFGDIRVTDMISQSMNRQTHIDIDEITLSALKYALMDSEKVSLSSEDGHSIFEVLDNGLNISTGLTVVLGKRSSGKSYTLDKINEQFDNAKYIPQFSLLSTDDAKSQKKFEQALNTKCNSVTEDFLAPFKVVIEDVYAIDLEQDEQEVETYLNVLKKAALEAERRDIFAKCKLFQETFFATKNLKVLNELISAVDLLIENTEYKDIISKHVNVDVLISLGISLREQYIKEQENNIKAQYINDLIDSIQRELQVRSSNTPVPDIDLYRIQMNICKIHTFNKIVEMVKQKRVIEQRNMYSYKVVAKAQPYSGAQEMQRMSKSKAVFSDAYKKYNNPYEFLQLLKQKAELPAPEYYKYFVSITYEVLNQYGTPASGGERSEYNLLQTLVDAARSEILILDEPESSFDNLFLKDGVNHLLKNLSKSIPVVIATHNNTIGASVHPDYLVYTLKEILPDGSVKYHLYSGYPSSGQLVDLEGNELNRREVMLDCLEAGEPAYIDRRTSYEIFCD